MNVIPPVLFDHDHEMSNCPRIVQPTAGCRLHSHCERQAHCQPCSGTVGLAWHHEDIMGTVAILGTDLLEENRFVGGTYILFKISKCICIYIYMYIILYIYISWSFLLAKYSDVLLALSQFFDGDTQVFCWLYHVCHVDSWGMVVPPPLRESW